VAVVSKSFISSIISENFGKWDPSNILHKKIYLLNIYFYFDQEANKRNNNWLPPPWALAAMAILGFNEFMTLLRYFFCLENIRGCHFWYFHI
jgi:hypothetical protein